jgi:hypothetical protein
VIDRARARARSTGHDRQVVLGRDWPIPFGGRIRSSPSSSIFSRGVDLPCVSLAKPPFTRAYRRVDWTVLFGCLRHAAMLWIDTPLVSFPVMEIAFKLRLMSWNSPPDLAFEPAAATRQDTIAGIAAAFRTRESWEQTITAIRPVPTGSLIDVDDDASDDSSSPIPIDPPIYHVPDDDLEDPPDHIPDRTCALGDVSDRPAAWFPTGESRGESTPIEILIDPSLDDPEHVPAEVPAEHVTADVSEEERWPGEIDNGPPPGPPASYQAVPFEQCYHCLNPHGLVRYVARNNTNAQKLWMNHLVQTGEPYWLCREHVCHNRITNPARACRDRATVIPPGRLKRPRGYLIPTSSGKPKCWRHHREDENGRLNKQEYHKRKSELNKQPVVRRDDAWNDP